MAVLPIKVYPDPVLARKCAPVEKIDRDCKKLIEDMADTMFSAAGIGLAAPQVGVSRCIIVVNMSSEKEPDQYWPLINPRIVHVEGELLVEEGCLSVPKYYAEVRRAQKVKVVYQDLQGETREAEAEDLLARVLQHEVDHLQGVLFIDHLSRLKRDLVRNRFRKKQIKNSKLS